MRCEEPFLPEAGPPELTYNEEDQLHSINGPAYRAHNRCIWYENGQKHGKDLDWYGSVNFYFRGVLIPPKYIKDPDSLTAKEILNHQNAEVRRVGLEIYGFDKLRDEGQLKVISKDKDTGAQLLGIDIEDDFNDDNQAKPARFVRVLDSTPRDDGYQKPYFLRVPPDMQNCKEAIAWTFGKDVETYNPIKET